MAELWYYTCEGKQMEPVTGLELQRLARSGVLKPTDMIWKAGMEGWISAGTHKHLFPDQQPAGTLAEAPVKPRPLSAVVAQQKLAPAREPVRERRSGRDPDRDSDEDDARERRRTRRRERDDDDEEDDRPRRRRRKPAGSNAAMIIGICAGGGVLLLVIVLVVVIALMSGGNRAGPAGQPAPAGLFGRAAPITYSVALPPGRDDTRSFRFRNGAHYHITVRSTFRGVLAPDVDLHILDQNGQILMADPSIGPDSQLLFSPFPEGDYKIRVINLGQPRVAAQSTVTIQEQ